MGPQQGDRSCRVLLFRNPNNPDAINANQGHQSLAYHAVGAPVLFAGELRVKKQNSQNSCTVSFWNNFSGHYRPGLADAKQITKWYDKKRAFDAKGPKTKIVKALQKPQNSFVFIDNAWLSM